MKLTKQYVEAARVLRSSARVFAEVIERFNDGDADDVELANAEADLQYAALCFAARKNAPGGGYGADE